jgi:hypothetical protein
VLQSNYDFIIRGTFVHDGGKFEGLYYRYNGATGHPYVYVFDTFMYVYNSGSGTIYWSPNEIQHLFTLYVLGQFNIRPGSSMGGSAISQQGTYVFTDGRDTVSGIILRNGTLVKEGQSISTPHNDVKDFADTWYHWNWDDVNQQAIEPLWLFGGVNAGWNPVTIDMKDRVLEAIELWNKLPTDTQNFWVTLYYLFDEIIPLPLPHLQSLLADIEQLEFVQFILDALAANAVEVNDYDELVLALAQSGDAVIRIMGDVQVASGAALTIGAGKTVIIDFSLYPSASLEFYGTLTMDGGNLIQIACVFNSFIWPFFNGAILNYNDNSRHAVFFPNWQGALDLFYVADEINQVLYRLSETGTYIYMLLDAQTGWSGFIKQ